MNKRNQEGTKFNKIYIAFIVVLLLLVGFFVFNLVKSNGKADYNNKVVKGNISLITSYDFSTVKSVETQIRELEDSESKGNFDTDRELTKDQYRKVFNTSVVIGDSITEGLEAYGYLGAEEVFCGIGASVMHGDDLFAQAANTYPKFAFFSFGMNDMGNYTGQADLFIEKYTKLIQAFQKTSPDTKILVNAISTPSKEAQASNSSLTNYKKFNSAIQTMCKDLGIQYIDNSYILKDHPEYYAGDGIHVTSEYYILWLNNMILKAGL